ncbi:MAG: sulfur carrier protein ThiS [Gammaproteobacteria bacterium]|nr:sulfur carrier protein ThiS [Gammaproteobacteria bacterium]
MNIMVNGKDVEIASHELKTIVETLGYQCHKVVIAVNQEFVAKEKWDDFRVSAGDTLDVLSPVEGG